MWFPPANVLRRPKKLMIFKIESALRNKFRVSKKRARRKRQRYEISFSRTMHSSHRDRYTGIRMDLVPDTLYSRSSNSKLWLSSSNNKQALLLPHETYRHFQT